MHERRRSPRFPVDGVRGSLVANAEARLLNLGRAGASLEAACELPPGSRCILRLGTGEAAVELPAEVAWSHLGGTRPAAGEALPVYETGVIFRLPAASDPVAEPGRALPADGCLLSEHTLTLLRVSQWGLLVETDLTPAAGSRVEVRLELASGAVETRCRVVYVKRLETPDAERRCQLGLEIVELSAAARQALDALLSERRRARQAAGG